MNILGLDYGRARIGVALSVDGIIEPVLQLDNRRGWEQPTSWIKSFCLQENVQQIVIGKVSGLFDKEIKRFTAKLKKEVGLPVFFVNEDLTSYEAEQLVKDKKKLDMVSAGLILDRFLSKD